MNSFFPNILLYSHFSSKEKFVYDVSAYESHVILIALSGSFIFQNTDGQMQYVYPGEALICPPGFPLHRSVVETLDLYVLRFELDSDIAQKTQTIAVNSRIRQCLDRLAHIGFCESSEMDAYTRHYSTDIVAEALHILSKRITQEDKDIAQIEQYLEEHFTLDITNDTLCRMISCSEATLIARFQRQTGTTPHKYLSKKRLEQAKNLITQTDLSINEIAEQCGFRDSLYFSRAFTKYCGVSASVFRKRHKI